MFGDWRIWSLILVAVFVGIWLLCQESEMGPSTSFPDLIASFLEQRYHDRQEMEQRLRELKNGINGYREAASRSRVGSRGAQETRIALEEIYDADFPPAQLSFLRDPDTGEYITLDCYNEERQIGARYLGIEHWHWPNFTGSTEEEHERQMILDEKVVDMCDANGVYLITIPYEVHHDDIREVVEYYLPENVEAREKENDYQNFMEI